MKTAAITGLLAGLAITAVSQPIPEASIQSLDSYIASSGNVKLPASAGQAGENTKAKRDADPADSVSGVIATLMELVNSAQDETAALNAAKALASIYRKTKRDSNSEALMKLLAMLIALKNKQQASGAAASESLQNVKRDDPNASSFNTLLEQFMELQQQTMTENLEMQKAQAFWNPLESISKKDATSKRSTEPQDTVEKRDANPSDSDSNASAFNAMLAQYNALQQQTMLENMEMQKAQAFWNPLESMSKKDATSKRSIEADESVQKRAASPSDSSDAFNTLLQQFNELQQQTMTENLEMQKAQAFWNPLESMSKKDATSKRSVTPLDDFQKRDASPQESSASSFASLLQQFNELQQQTMLENLEMQKAQAFWNPLESMSKKDATSKRSVNLEDDLEKRNADPQDSNASSFASLLQQFNELQQQTMIENLEMQKAQAFWNPLESMSKKDATSKRSVESEDAPEKRNVADTVAAQVQAGMVDAMVANMRQSQKLKNAGSGSLELSKKSTIDVNGPLIGPPSAYQSTGTITGNEGKAGKIWGEGIAPEVLEQINNHLAWSAMQNEKRAEKWTA